MKNKELRKTILEESYKAGACHLGSALSCVDIIDDIYMKKRKTDVFVFSKASGICALYVVLEKYKIIPKVDITYYLKHYPLPSKEVPGVIWSGGSLGMGLSFSCGLALANRRRRVYCLISDGECQEGNVYEAALFARQHKLKNLFVVCDNNEIQAMGKTKDILNLDTAFNFFKKTFPNFKNVKTIKGKGVSFMENECSWHYKNLDEKLLNQALTELS